MAALARQLEQNERAGMQSIVLLAPIFTKENERDGYFQRVKAIDESALPGLFRIYLYNQRRFVKRMRALRVDPNHAEILFNGQDDAHREEIRRLIRRCGRVYAHSVHQLLDAQGRLMPLFDDAEALKIWDVHGAVPEENALAGRGAFAALAEQAEAYAYARADVIVTVSRAMQAHLEAKHGERQGRWINLPIFAQGAGGAEPPTADRDAPEPTAASSPAAPARSVVVYAGGLQDWQNIDKMRELVAATHARYEYRFYVPEPKRLRQMWDGHVPLDKLLIASAPPERMHEAYQGCHYGLLLREDSPINSVACPTKLVEYLRHGIVPVLLSEHVGDFVEMGMGYVRLEALLRGEVPEEARRRGMAEGNREVLEKMSERSHCGCESLGGIVERHICRSNCR